MKNVSTLKMYKRIPLSCRNRFHLVTHRVNSNRSLLTLLKYRHKLTCRKLRSYGFVRLRVGESAHFNGWISTNYLALCRNFLDVTKPLVGVQNLQFVIADNVIEHLSLTKGRAMLENLYNAMLPAATLRLSTPNLRELANRYVASDFSSLEPLKFDLRQHSVSLEYCPDLLRVQFTSFGHEKGYLYDFETLREILLQIGFRNVRQFETSLSTIPQLVDAENRRSPSDSWAQLCIEAEK